MLEQRIAELKAIIASNDGSNAADARFARAVDELISAVYDDIGRIREERPRALFDLFVIKVLYVGRGSRHADIIDYLGALLDACLYARRLFPDDAEGRPRTLYFSDVLDEHRRIEFFDDRFEAYRTYADSALFLSGVFAPATQRRRARGHGPMRGQHAGIDQQYYVSTGKTMYRMAARQREAERTSQRDTLERLADCFEVYADALNEMSERYIMGFDLALLTDKMLDNYNRHRASGERTARDDAQRIASLLQADASTFPELYGD